MKPLDSLLDDASTLAGTGAFISWWVAVFLGVQLSRHRAEPEAPTYRRRWEVAMLVFAGFFALIIVLAFFRSWLHHHLP